MMGSVRPFSSLMALGAVVLLSACAPNCERTCRKLDSCAADGSTMTLIECESTCTTLIQSFARDEDEVRKESFAAHRRCVVSATCDEVNDGVCYDETLFAF
jgi:hypothetical protein